MNVVRYKNNDSRNISKWTQNKNSARHYCQQDTENNENQWHCGRGFCQIVSEIRLFLSETLAPVRKMLSRNAKFEAENPHFGKIVTI